MTSLPIFSAAARGGLLGAHQLDELHRRGRVEEVHPDHLGRSRRRGGELGEGQRRGVRREHGVLGSPFADVGEDLDLDRELFRSGLDHQFGARGHLLHGRGADEQRLRHLRLGRGQLSLGQRGGKAGPGLREALLQGSGVRVVERGGEAGLGRQLRDAVAHGAGAEHPYLGESSGCGGHG
jgi:hypothetical protein